MSQLLLRDLAPGSRPAGPESGPDTAAAGVQTTLVHTCVCASARLVCGAEDDGFFVLGSFAVSSPQGHSQQKPAHFHKAHNLSNSFTWWPRPVGRAGTREPAWGPLTLHPQGRGHDSAPNTAEDWKGGQMVKNLQKGGEEIGILLDLS